MGRASPVGIHLIAIQFEISVIASFLAFVVDLAEWGRSSVGADKVGSVERTKDESDAFSRILLSFSVIYLGENSLDVIKNIDYDSYTSRHLCARTNTKLM